MTDFTHCTIQIKPQYQIAESNSQPTFLQGGRCTQNRKFIGCLSTRYRSANTVSCGVVFQTLEQSESFHSSTTQKVLLELYRTWDKVLIGPELRHDIDSLPNPLPWSHPLVAPLSSVKPSLSQSARSSVVSSRSPTKPSPSKSSPSCSQESQSCLTKDVINNRINNVANTA